MYLLAGMLLLGLVAYTVHGLGLVANVQSKFTITSRK